MDFINHMILKGVKFIGDSILIAEPETINDHIITSNLTIKNSISPYPYIEFPIIIFTQ